MIRRILGGVWPSLPALTVGSAAVCVAAVVPVVIAPGVNPLSVVLAAIAVAPFAAALVSVVNDLAGDEVATIHSWAHACRALWRFAITQALLAAVPVVLFLAAFEVLTQTGSVLAWPSFAATGAVTVVALLALTAAVPLGAADPALRGTRLWFTSIAVVARHPSRFIAVACAVGFGLWCAANVTASLLLLVPAPAAIVAVAATWTSIPSIPERNPS